MPITITADTAAELPESLRPLAKETDGKFVVSSMPEGFGFDNVQAIRSKATKAEKDAQRAADRLKTFAKDDQGTLYEPDEFKELVAEYQRLKEAQGKAPNVDDIRKQLTTDYETRFNKKLADAEKAKIDAENDSKRTMLDAAINEALAESRPKEGKGHVVRLLIGERADVAEEGGKRHVRVRTPDRSDWMTGGADGFLTVKDYTLNMLRTQHPDLFAGDGQSGAGAQSTNGAGRRAGTVKLSRAEMNGKGGDVMKAYDAALAAKQTVEWVD